MKILEVLSTFDLDYIKYRKNTQASIFEFIIVTFGATSTNNYSALSVASVKLKDLLKTQPDMSEYEMAELMSDTTNLLYNLIERLTVAGVCDPLSYIKAYGNPTTLLEAKGVLLEVQEISSPEFLGLYNEIYSNRKTLDFEPMVCYEDGDVGFYTGILGVAVNITGYKELGVCYTTSAQDVHELAPNLVVSPGVPLPIIINSGKNNPFSQLSDTDGIRARQLDIVIPLMKV